MTKNVVGKRSPNWAFMQKMVIPCEDGSDYLVRLRIIQTPWFGVYLHDLEGPDKEAPHDHPWNFISFIVKGSYTETVWQFPHVFPVEDRTFRYQRTWNQFSWHKMPRDRAHRIMSVLPGTKSLILTGPRRKNWGFFTSTGWVPWNEYEETAT